MCIRDRSPRVGAAANEARPRAYSMARTISSHAHLWPMNAATATSLAPFIVQAAVPRRRRHSQAISSAGYFARSTPANVSCGCAMKSNRSPGRVARRGYISAKLIGIRMSGVPSCALIAPSSNSTIECTIDCGCSSTVIFSTGVPNSQCASITSKPLFTSVDESIRCV